MTAPTAQRQAAQDGNSNQRSAVTIREATAADVEPCGRICFDAFAGINTKHGFPPDFPAPEVTVGIMASLFGQPGFHCLVAEQDCRVVGSNCMDERSSVYGIGPITVDPQAQNAGIGRQLMEAMMRRAAQRGAAGVRLVQAAFHSRSLALYTRLGFDVREPLACMQGRATQRTVPGCEVRPAETGDIEECAALSRRLHGFDRTAELAAAIPMGAAMNALVVKRGGNITAYCTSLAFFGHAMAETNADLQAMLGAVEGFGGSGILVPTRNATLFRWCLDNGLRVVQPMTLMSTGLYNEPVGAWVPSILF